MLEGQVVSALDSIAKGKEVAAPEKKRKRKKKKDKTEKKQGEEEVR